MENFLNLTWTYMQLFNFECFSLV